MALLSLVKRPLPQWELGHLAALQEQGRERFTGASAASHELKQLEPEVRSQISTPGMQGHPGSLCCLVLQPAFPVPRAGPGTAGTGSFLCREHDFPSRKRAGPCRDQALFVLCWIPIASLPSDFAGTQTWAAASFTDGSRGCRCFYSCGLGAAWLSVRAGDSCIWFC